ncbi:hypothetical protein L342_0732 [Escherichia coli CE516]|nr:hypothetical protein L342_0732 [Escherichia coli CE516]EST01299.1 hypothetical protein L341_1441 [Escherichia coli CE418]
MIDARHYFSFLAQGMGYFLNFVTIQLMFKAAQTFVDRHQLNQCGP